MSAPEAALSALDYLLFDPAPWRFPAAALPVLPVLRRGALRTGTARAAWSTGAHRFYLRARYALRDAFAASGVGPDGALLAPAYHCRTMLDPALVLGAPVRLFPLLSDLRPDLAAVEQLLRHASVPVRAVLMPHYFGLVQDLEPMAALCRRHGARLVEDCAHALPLATPDNRMGRTGDWCVASPYKFFPCADGGVLWSGSGQNVLADLVLKAPGMRAELRQLLQLRTQSARRPPVRPVAQVLAEPPTSDQQDAMAVSARQAGPSTDYQESEAGLRCSAVSRWLIDHADIADLVARRRKNYQVWASAAEGFSGAQAWRPQLGPSDTPYMFPLLIDAPLQQFTQLKRAGVPIYRWDSLASSECRNSARFRLHLLHLPCHQGLRPTDLDWLIETVRLALQAPIKRVSS